MTLKFYLWGIGLASLVALSSFLAIIWFFAPQNADAAILSLLFFSLFLALCGFFSLLGFYVRRKRLKEEIPIYHLGISFREGTLLSILVVGFLLMRSLNFFYWWSALTLLIIIIAVEAGFLWKEK